MKAFNRNAGSDAGLLIGRIALAAVFLDAGWGKLTTWPAIVHLMVVLHAPFPTLGSIVAIICELGGGALIVLGLRTRSAALVLIVFSLGANWLAHQFWLLHGHAAYESRIQFFLDLSLCGGLLILASVGPGRFSADRG